MCCNLLYTVMRRSTSFLPSVRIKKIKIFKWKGFYFYFYAPFKKCGLHTLGKVFLLELKKWFGKSSFFPVVMYFLLKIGVGAEHIERLVSF